MPQPFSLRRLPTAIAVHYRSLIRARARSPIDRRRNPPSSTTTVYAPRASGGHLRQTRLKVATVKLLSYLQATPREISSLWRGLVILACPRELARPSGGGKISGSMAGAKKCEKPGTSPADAIAATAARSKV